MPARLAISHAGRNGQYVGTSRTAPPAATPGSATARRFNGRSDRMVGRRSVDLGAEFVLVCSFWRGEGTTLADDLVAGRIFSQYAVGGTRVAVGINRSYLAITYLRSDGTVVVKESDFQLLDMDRHVLALQVTATEVIVYLDGRESIRVTATLAAPDTALTVIGADANARFFSGYLDDLAIYKTVPRYFDNWVRYYRALILGENPRDYVAAPFSPGYHDTTLTVQGFVATGTQANPASSVALSAAWRMEPELEVQFVEFAPFASANNDQIAYGVINDTHNLGQYALGVTAGSYAFRQDGTVLHDNTVSVTGLPTWVGSDVMALGWVNSTRTLSLWRNGTRIYSMALPAGTWTPAVVLGANVVRLNSGQAPWRSLPVGTPGLPAVAFSRLNTEFRHMRLAELVAPLNDTGLFVMDAASGLQVGTYTAPRELVSGFTADSLDLATQVGGGIKIAFGDHTKADEDFFFAIAFSPLESDLLGEKVLLDGGGWSLQLLDGRINARVGDLQLSSTEVAFDAGGRYLIGMTRTLSGKLMLWGHTGYMLQSAEATLVQASSDVYVGSKADGTAKFAGKLSHLILAATRPADWKIERLRKCYSWTVPNIAGIVPNAIEVRKVFEPSWRDVIKVGISSSPAASNCFVAAVAKAPDELAVEYRMVSQQGEAAYTGEPVKPWTATGVLAAPLSRTTTLVTLSEFSDLTPVAVGEAVLIDDEICRIDSINRTTGELTIARGCVDTVPEPHTAGARVWFYEDNLASTRTTYPNASQVNVKLLSRSELAEQPEEFAPVDTLWMVGRLARPYPPAGVTINDLLSPTELGGTVSVKWAHRNKAAQGTNLVGYYEPTSTAPTSVTYLVRMLDKASGAVLHQSSPQASTVGDYDLFVEHTGDVTVTVSAVENGVESLHSPAIDFYYTSETTVIVTTEEGEALQTEDETYNILAEDITAATQSSYSGNLADDYEEEEEEEVIGGAAAGDGTGSVILGVKMSEFSQYPVGFVGDEMVPLVKNGTNYWANMAEFIQYVINTVPQPQDGKSAYDLAVEQGFAGSLDEYLESLRGPEGPSSNMSRRVQTISVASGAIICNWANYDEIRLRLTGPVTLTFQGARDSQGCMLKLEQDAVGGRTVTLPANVRYNVLIQQYNPSINPGLVDKVGFVYDGTDSSYDFVSLVPGISA